MAQRRRPERERAPLHHRRRGTSFHNEPIRLLRSPKITRSSSAILFATAACNSHRRFCAVPLSPVGWPHGRISRRPLPSHRRPPCRRPPPTAPRVPLRRFDGPRGRSVRQRAALGQVRSQPGPSTHGRATPLPRTPSHLLLTPSSTGARRPATTAALGVAGERSTNYLVDGCANATMR